jgi:hypothetical protein
MHSLTTVTKFASEEGVGGGDAAGDSGRNFFQDTDNNLHDYPVL